MANPMDQITYPVSWTLVSTALDSTYKTRIDSQDKKPAPATHNLHSIL